MESLQPGTEGEGCGQLTPASSCSLPSGCPPPQIALTPVQAGCKAQSPQDGTRARGSDDRPLWTAEPYPPASILSGASRWGGAKGGQRGSVHLPSFCHPTRLSLRAQAPGSPRGTSSGPSGAHSWASVVNRVESLGCSFKNKFFFSLKRSIKIIVHSIKGRC